MTKAEVVLWLHLRSLRDIGYNFRRQHPVGPYIADFAIFTARLIVEVDGGTHGTDKEIAHDQKRDAYLRSKGWRVLRVRNADIYDDVNWVVELILAHLPLPVRPNSRSDEPPPPQAGEDSKTVRRRDSAMRAAPTESQRENR